MMKVVHAISNILNRSPLEADILDEVVEMGEYLQDLVEDINVANGKSSNLTTFQKQESALFYEISAIFVWCKENEPTRLK